MALDSLTSDEIGALHGFARAAGNRQVKDICVKALAGKLRRKFAKPGDAVKVLGLDAALLTPTENSKHDFRVALEQLLEQSSSVEGDVKRQILELLDQYLPIGNHAKAAQAREDEIEQNEERDGAETLADRVRARTGGADRRRARDEDEPIDVETALGRIRKFLKEEKKWTDDAIAEAMPLFRRNIEQGGGDAMLRRNAMAGGIGGLATHAMDAASSFKQMFGDDGVRIKADLTAAELASLNRLAPGLKKIRSDASLMRRPTAREAADFEKFYPEAMRIRTGPGR